MTSSSRIVRRYAALRLADSDGSYMSVQNLRSIHSHAAKMLEVMDANTALPDWVESKISRASGQILDVFEYFQHGEEDKCSRHGETDL